jgi:hypothetical protein
VQSLQQIENILNGPLSCLNKTRLPAENAADRTGSRGRGKKLGVEVARPLAIWLLYQVRSDGGDKLFVHYARDMAPLIVKPFCKTDVLSLL